MDVGYRGRIVSAQRCLEQKQKKGNDMHRYHFTLARGRSPLRIQSSDFVILSTGTATENSMMRGSSADTTCPKLPAPSVVDTPEKFVWLKTLKKLRSELEFLVFRNPEVLVETHVEVDHPGTRDNPWSALPKKP